MNHRATFISLFLTLYGLHFAEAKMLLAESPEKAATRWAILDASEIADLTTLELSKVPGIELVEREHFDTILKEQRLVSLAGEGGVTRRLELGKMLAADRLLLFQAVEEGKQKGIRVVVFDTGSAATIFDETFFGKDNPEEIAKIIASIVVELNEEFKDGVLHAIAVPDFLLKNPTPESSLHGRRFARLIAATLLQTKGTAVVSFEELKALQREQAVGSIDVRRLVPLLIRGQFEAVKKDGEFEFDISIVVSDGAKSEETFEKTGLSEKETADFLGRVIPKRILERLGQDDDVPLTLEMQEKEFSRIADRFHEFGAFKTAMDYREAILLLSPKNAGERLKFLSEQTTLTGQSPYRGPLASVYPHIRYIFEHKLVSFEMGCSAYLRFMRYAEAEKNEMGAKDFYPIKHAANCAVLPLLLELPRSETVGESDLKYIWTAAPPQGEYHGKKNRARDFLLQGRMITLAYINGAVSNPETVLQDAIPVFSRFPGDSSIPVFTEIGHWNWKSPVIRSAIARDDEKTTSFIEELRKTKKRNLVFLADFLDVFLDMEVRGDAVSVPLSKIEELQAELARLTPGDFVDKQRHETFDDYVYYRNTLAEYRTTIEKAVQKAKKGFTPPEIPNPLSLAPEPPIVVDAPFSLEPIDEWSEILKKHFSRPVSKRFYYGATTDYRCFDVRLEKLDEKTDFLWNRHAVCTLRRLESGGIVSETIFETQADDPILHAKSDGKNIWLSTSRGVFCLNSSGFSVATIGSADLPDYSAPKASGSFGEYPWMIRVDLYNMTNMMRDAMEIQGETQYVLAVDPIAAGDVLLYGRSGTSQRTWIGRVRLDERNKPTFKMLLNANRTLSENGDYENEKTKTSAEDKDIVFTVSDSTNFEPDGKDGPRFKLLGRYFSYRTEAGPLLIDLETDEVTTLASQYPSLKDLRTGWALASVGGSIVTVEGKDVHVANDPAFWKHHRRDTGGRARLTVGALTVYRTNISGEWSKIDLSLDRLSDKIVRNQSWTLIQRGKTVVSPGFPWLELDFSADETRVKELVAETIPAPFTTPYNSIKFTARGLMTTEKMERLQRFSDSVMFGTWAGPVAPNDSFYSVNPHQAYRIDWNKPSKNEFPPEARHVPMENLEKHVEAVRKIRSLDGFAGSNALFEKVGVQMIFGHKFNYDNFPQRTVVVLTSDWKGTPNDLAVLEQLDRFEEIYFFDRIVSNEEAEALSRFHSIRTIHFIRSSINPVGLELLEKIPFRQLSLYPHPDGPRFGDETVEFFQGKRHWIRCLFIVGPGFTEKTAKILTVGQPERLRIVGTEISPRALQELKNKLLSRGQSNISFSDE